MTKVANKKGVLRFSLGISIYSASIFQNWKDIRKICVYKRVIF